MFSSTCASTKKGSAPNLQILFAYKLFLGLAAAAWHFVANGEFSAMLTMAEMLQCFAFIILALQVVSSGSVAGISAHSLTLEAISLGCRLSCTTWLNGYLPVDASGDWLYQTVDIVSVGVIFWLFREVTKVRRSTYQVEGDTFPIKPVAIVCVVLGILFHADMNSRPFFDSLWMIGLFLGAVAVMPQLWLVARTGGKVEALTSHYIAMMAFGRLLSGIFMWHARGEVTCKEWTVGVNHAVWAILSAHFLHLILLIDFAFVYLRTMITKGLKARVELEGCANFV